MTGCALPLTDSAMQGSARARAKVQPCCPSLPCWRRGCDSTKQVAGQSAHTINVGEKIHLFPMQNH